MSNCPGAAVIGVCQPKQGLAIVLGNITRLEVDQLLNEGVELPTMSAANSLTIRHILGESGEQMKGWLRTPRASRVTTAPMLASPQGRLIRSRSDPSGPRLASSRMSRSASLCGALRKCSHLYWLMHAPMARAADKLAPVEKMAMAPVMLSGPPCQSSFGRSWKLKRMATMLSMHPILNARASSSNRHPNAELEGAAGGTSAALSSLLGEWTASSVQNAPDFLSS